ncbi:hypothetical protein ACFTQ7_10915 [Lysinibacillus sp. NPDC056959]|uniref:hypothetical protein n=1 Tax=Lysinibacillus sp. NPDC056959 TaxID=3345981 RepID=UPI00362BDA73
MDVLNEQELMDINGGGLVSGIAGGLLGGGAGFLGGSAAVIAGYTTGNMNGEKARAIIKDTTMGFAGAGALAGGLSPLP